MTCNFWYHHSYPLQRSQVSHVSIRIESNSILTLVLLYYWDYKSVNPNRKLNLITWWICFSFKKVDRRSAIIHVLPRLRPLKGHTCVDFIFLSFKNKSFSECLLYLCYFSVEKRRSIYYNFLCVNIILSLTICFGGFVNELNQPFETTTLITFENVFALLYF